MKKEMTNINESKVLLDIEFEDSLQEGNFSVKISQNFYNIVLGECIEVIIEHDTDPELCLNATYQPGKFPEDLYRDLVFRGWRSPDEPFKASFYRDLVFRGWSFILEELSEKL